MVSLVIQSRGHMQGQAFFQLVHREVRPQKHGASVVKRTLLKDFVSVQSKRMLFREDLRETFFNFVGNFIYYWPSVLSFVFDYYSRVSTNRTYQSCNFEFSTMYGQIKMDPFGDFKLILENFITLLTTRVEITTKVSNSELQLR